MSPRCAAALALATLILAGCDKSPTSPPPPPLHRTVTVAVSDSLGAPAPGVDLWCVSEWDSAGFAQLRNATTDAGGNATFVLHEGDWGLHGRRPATRWVGGATFDVPGRTRPAIDTIVVRIGLHTAAWARGRVRLAGRTDHSGVVIDCPPVPSVVVTDISGTYTLDLLPLGHWTITMFATGFALGLAPIDVTTPGQTVLVPDKQLISSP
jgi:hypothetical protein